MVFYCLGVSVYMALHFITLCHIMISVSIFYLELQVQSCVQTDQFLLANFCPV
jgi:hypothetical protein